MVTAVSMLEEISKLDNDVTWYNSLSTNTKREVLTEAINKFPYLATYMKMHRIRGSDDGFVDHFTFKLMVEVLRGNKKNE